MEDFAEQNRALEDECLRLEDRWKHLQVSGWKDLLDFGDEPAGLQAEVVDRDELQELLAEVDAWRGLHELECEACERREEEVAALCEEAERRQGSGSGLLERHEEALLVVGEERDRLSEEVEALRKAECQRENRSGPLESHEEALCAVGEERDRLVEELEALRRAECRSGPLERHGEALAAVGEERDRLAEEVEALRRAREVAMDEEERRARHAHAAAAESLSVLEGEIEALRRAHEEGVGMREAELGAAERQRSELLEELEELRGSQAGAAYEADTCRVEGRERELLEEVEELRSEHARARQKAQDLRRRSTAKGESAERAREEAEEAKEQVTKLEGRLERWKRRHADEVERREAADERAAEAHKAHELHAQEGQQRVEALSQAVERFEQARANAREEGRGEVDGASASAEGVSIEASEELERLRSAHAEELRRLRPARDAEIEEAQRTVAGVREQVSKLEGRLERWKRRHADEVERREAADAELEEARRAKGRQREEGEEMLQDNSPGVAEEFAALSEEVERWREEHDELRRRFEHEADFAEELERLRTEYEEGAEEAAMADEQATKLEMRVERWRRRHTAEVERREAAVEDLLKAEQALQLRAEGAEEAGDEAGAELAGGAGAAELRRSREQLELAAAEEEALRAAADEAHSEAAGLASLVEEWREVHAAEVGRRELVAAEAADAAEAQVLGLRAGLEEWRRSYIEEAQSREEALRDELEALQAWREDPDVEDRGGGAVAACRWRCFAEALLRDECSQAASRSTRRAVALAALRWGGLAWRLQRQAGDAEAAAFGVRHATFLVTNCRARLADRYQEEHSELQYALQACAQESMEVRDLQESRDELLEQAAAEHRLMEESRQAAREEASELRRALEESRRAMREEASESRRALEELRHTTPANPRPQVAGGAAFLAVDLESGIATASRGGRNPFLTPRGSADGGSETDPNTPRGADAALSSGASAGSGTPRASLRLPNGQTLRAGPRARLAFRREVQEARETGSEAVAGTRDVAG